MKHKTTVLILGLMAVMVPIFGQENGGLAEVEAPANPDEGVSFYMGVSEDLIIPLAAFAQFYDYGSGRSVEMDVENIFLDDLLFGAALSSYKFNSLRSVEESLFSLLFSLRGGYKFNVTENLSITPNQGFGFMLHMISLSTNRQFLFNPFMQLRVNLEYRFLDSLFFTLSPGYNIYFETGNVGQYLGFAVGLKVIL